MSRIEDIVARMLANPSGMRFADVKGACEHYFGAPRQHGTSHCVLKTPWPGDPRVNILSGDMEKWARGDMRNWTPSD
jgi:hypothetical protein